jgi:hypothetical protein
MGSPVGAFVGTACPRLKAASKSRVIGSGGRSRFSLGRLNAEHGVDQDYCVEAESDGDRGKEADDGAIALAGDDDDEESETRRSLTGCSLSARAGSSAWTTRVFLQAGLLRGGPTGRQIDRLEARPQL